VKDRRGEEMTADHGGSFIEVEQPGLVAGRVNRFKGLVRAIETDAKGPIIRIGVWSAGGLTGREAAVRPEHCLVVQGPKRLREAQAETARIATGRRLKAEADAHAKRMIELQKARS